MIEDGRIAVLCDSHLVFGLSFLHFSDVGSCDDIPD